VFGSPGNALYIIIFLSEVPFDSPTLTVGLAADRKNTPLVYRAGGEVKIGIAN